ncbi:Ig-like domain-containing protein, partial [Vibrio jasicida]
TATFGGVQSNDATLTVTSAELVSIQVTPADKSIPKGTNQKYIATGTYTDNSTKDISTNVSWTSSDTDIATIVNGLASGVAEGETTITATFGGV